MGARRPPGPAGVALPEDSTHLKYADAAARLFATALAAALSDAAIDPTSAALPMAFVAEGCVDASIQEFWGELREGGPVSPSLFAMTQPASPAAVTARIWDWTVPARGWVGGGESLHAASACVFAWLARDAAPAAVLGGIRAKGPRRRRTRTAWAMILARAGAVRQKS